MQLFGFGFRKARFLQKADLFHDFRNRMGLCKREREEQNVVHLQSFNVRFRRKLRSVRVPPIRYRTLPMKFLENSVSMGHCWLLFHC